MVNYKKCFIVVSQKIWLSNFVNKIIFLLKAKKNISKICFQNYICHVFQFHHNAPVLSYTCWWWLPSDLVSQPFCKHTFSNFIRNNYTLKNLSTFTVNFRSEHSKLKAYFAEFLQKLQYMKNLLHKNFYMKISRFTGECGKYNHQLCYNAIVHTYTCSKCTSNLQSPLTRIHSFRKSTQVTQTIARKSQKWKAITFFIHSATHSLVEPTYT